MSTVWTRSGALQTPVLQGGGCSLGGRCYGSKLRRQNLWWVCALDSTRYPGSLVFSCSPEQLQGNTRAAVMKLSRDTGNKLGRVNLAILCFCLKAAIETLDTFPTINCLKNGKSPETDNFPLKLSKEATYQRVASSNSNMGRSGPSRYKGSCDCYHL